jgi:hypothetical protein
MIHPSTRFAYVTQGKLATSHVNCGPYRGTGSKPKLGSARSSKKIAVKT